MHVVSRTDSTVNGVCISAQKTIFDDCSNHKSSAHYAYHIVTTLQSHLNFPLRFMTKSLYLLDPPSFSLPHTFAASFTPYNSYVHIQVGCTALYCAAWKGHVAVVQLLLQRHADVSICKEV